MREIYFINAQGEQIGPINECDIPQYPISADTMVWFCGLPRWEKASAVPEVNAYLMPATPPPPPMPNQHYNNAAPTPQQPFSPNIADKKPDSYLWLTILTTVLCCVPLGAVGIFFSNQVDSKWNSGDCEGARSSSKNALVCSLVSVGLGLILFMLTFIFMILE